jgi:hypothetical protein
VGVRLPRGIPVAQGCHALLPLLPTLSPWPWLGEEEGAQLGETARDGQQPRGGAGPWRKRRRRGGASRGEEEVVFLLGKLAYGSSNEQKMGRMTRVQLRIKRKGLLHELGIAFGCMLCQSMAQSSQDVLWAVT